MQLPLHETREIRADPNHDADVPADVREHLSMLLARLHVLVEDQEKMMAGLLAQGNGKAPAPPSKPKAGRKERTLRFDAISIPETQAFPEFYEKARQLAQALYAAIREDQTIEKLRIIQQTVLEHWAHATEAHLKDAAATEHRREAGFHRLQIFLDRAHSIHDSCASALEADIARRNPFVVPSLMSDDGFFDHHLQKTCTAECITKSPRRAAKG